MKTCKTCKLNRGICQVFKEKTLDTDTCPQYVGYTLTCDCCGSEFIPTAAIIDGEKIFCSDCGHNLNTCITCRLGHVCEFESNPGGPPKMVQKTVNQGGMIASMAVPNPERVDFFCVRNNCPCYDQNLGICLKKSQGCAKWSLSESHN